MSHIPRRTTACATVTVRQLSSSHWSHPLILPVFASCATLRPYLPQLDIIFNDWHAYKGQVPTAGAIMLNESCDKVPSHPTPMCRRFVLNQPAEELASFERILFAVEQAHWFYEDVTRETDPNLRTLPLKDFMHLSIPTLHTSSLPPYLFCFYMWKYDCLMFQTMAVYVRIYVYIYIIVFIV